MVVGGIKTSDVFVDCDIADNSFFKNITLQI